MPGTLNGLAYHALMFCTGSGGSARNNLAAIGGKSLRDTCHLLVVDGFNFLYAENTDFASWTTKLAILTAGFSPTT